MRKPSFRAFLEKNKAKKKFVKALVGNYERFKGNPANTVLKMWEEFLVKNNSMTIRNLINCAFSWNQTEQGAKFWSDLSFAWEEKCEKWIKN